MGFWDIKAQQVPLWTILLWMALSAGYSATVSKIPDSLGLLCVMAFGIMICQMIFGLYQDRAIQWAGKWIGTGDLILLAGCAPYVMARDVSLFFISIGVILGATGFISTKKSIPFLPILFGTLWVQYGLARFCS